MKKLLLFMLIFVLTGTSCAFAEEEEQTALKSKSPTV